MTEADGTGAGGPAGAPPASPVGLALLAVLAGHGLGALALAAVIGIAPGWSELTREGGVTLASLAWAPVGAAAFMVTMGGLVLFGMLPLSVIALPVSLPAALFLRTGRAATTLLGALTAVLVGWPAFQFVYGDPRGVLALEPGFAAGLAVAGACYAQPIWAWCIRPRRAARAAGAGP